MKRRKSIILLMGLIITIFGVGLNLNASNINVENFSLYSEINLKSGKKINVYQSNIDKSYITKEKNLTNEDKEEVDNYVQKELEKDVKDRQAKGTYYNTTPDGKIATYFTSSGKTHKVTSGYYTLWGQDTYMIYKPTNQIIYCLNAFDPVGSVTSTSGASDYNKLDPISKQKVDDYATLGTDNYYRLKSSNLSAAEDYLFAGQMRVWDYANKGYKKEIWKVQSYYYNLGNQQKKMRAKPSFSNRTEDSVTQNHTLNWNNTTNQYEVVLTDKNGVWDSKFSFYGTIGDYTLSNPSGANNVKIATKNHKAKSVTFSPSNTSGLEYDPASHIPASKKTPIYLTTTGQDVTSGRDDPVKVKFGVKINPVKGKAEFVKVENDSTSINGNNTNEPLEGAEFGLYKSNGTKVKTLKSDKNGKVNTGDLLVEKYYIQETKAPVGYVLDNTKYYFTIQPNKTISINNNKPIENRAIKGKVTLKKEVKYPKRTKDNDNSKTNITLPGVEFTIYEDINNNKVIDKNDKPIEKITTDFNGNATSGYLKYGNYVLKETKAPIQVVMSDKQYPFSITKENEVIKINNGNSIINYLKVKDFKIIKKNQFDELMSGVKFNVYYDVNGNQIIDKEDFLMEKLITDENGEAYSGNLPLGTYLIQESETPEGYLTNKETYMVKLSDTKEINKPIVIDIENKMIEGKISLVKEDYKTHEVLPGAEFKIYNDLNSNKVLDEEEKTKDNVVEVLNTNLEGYAESSKLRYGDYILKETKAPVGYVFNDNLEKDFEINKEDQLIKFEITNKKMKKNLITTGKTMVSIVSFLDIVAVGIVIFLIKKKRK